MLRTLLTRYWREAAIVAAVVLAGWLVYDAVSDWKNATRQAAHNAARVAELTDLLAQRDAALASWQKRADEWRHAQVTAAAVATKQDAELAASRRAAETHRRRYREALAKLETADLACANLRVPAAVDRLLGQPASQATPTR